MKLWGIILRSDLFWILSQFFIQAVCLFNFFIGKQILYGEAQYYTSWSLWLEKTGYAWMNIGLGIPAAQGIANHFPILYIFSFLEKSGIPFNIIQYFWFLSLLFLPFLCMYLLIKKITRLSPWILYVFASAYVYNPIYLQHWISVNPWLMGIYYVIPLYWLILSISWDSHLVTFLASNIMFFASVYLFANPPYLVISGLAIIAALPILSITNNTPLFSKFNFVKVMIIFLSFCLINNFVIANLLLNFQQSVGTYLSTVNSHEILYQNSAYALISRVFSFRHLFADNPDFTSLNRLLAGKFSILLLYIPIITILFIGSTSKRSTRLHILLAYIAVSIFFVKALNPPFSPVFLKFFDTIPLFSIFKSAPEKFSPLYLFFIILSISLGYEYVEKFHQKIILTVMTLWIIFFQIPLVTFQLIPSIRHLGVTFTHTISNPSYISKSIDFFQNKDQLSTVLALPGEMNYLSVMKLDSNNYYLGLNPITNNIPQKTIEAHQNDLTTKLVYNSLKDDYFMNLLPIYGVKYIIVNKKIIKGFGFINNLNQAYYEKALSRKGLSPQIIDKSIEIYTLPISFPRIYIPNETYSTNIMPDLIQYLKHIDLTQKKVAFFYKARNPFPSEIKNVPRVVYKRIDPTKYRISVISASSNFPLVLDESYNKYWRLYPIDITPQSSKRQVYTDFLSKIFATLSKTSLKESSHFLVNGYANTWNISPKIICSTVICHKNNDGSYNMEFVIEYWPQYTVTLGIAFTSIITFLSLLFLTARLILNKIHAF